jgi:hypothetical protein
MFEWLFEYVGDVDRVEVLAPWQLSDGELTASILAAETALCREYARTLTLVAEIENRGLASENGFRTTAGMLVRSLRVSQKEANARVTQAAAATPAMLDALARGEINREHVAEITKTLAQAPDDLPAEARSADEDTLITLARQAIPSVVRRACNQLLGYWGIEGKCPKDNDRDLAQPLREFECSYTPEGRWKFFGEFDRELGEVAEGLFTTLAAPRPADEFGNPDPRTKAERQGDAMAEIFGFATRTPDLPVKGGERATMTVVVRLEDLERRAGTALIEGYGAMSASQLRRVCCEAKVIPAVLGTAGEVLDMGRAVRHATAAQRRALAVRDGGCTGPGCDRGPKWCIPHHIVSWADGGATDLSNLGFACEREHRLLHHGGWDMELRNGTIYWLPPAWLDPERKPIRNTAHDPPQHRTA